MLFLGLFVYGGNFVVRWRSTQHVLRVLAPPVEELGANGEERTVSVLFADIRDFTTYSEGHSARAVVALLNDYFTALVPIVERHGGTLTQYMGDGMMVLFGAPEKYADHAVRAVRTAVEMVHRVHALKETWEKHDQPDLRIGVGIHTGSAIVGMVGSPQRLNYTAIGDTVNAAARIESQNKEFGTEILISAETYKELPAEERKTLACETVGRPAQVKGRGQILHLHPVRVASTPAGNH